MNSITTDKQLTVKQMVFLVLVVPFILLIFLELLCRLLNLENVFSPTRSSMQLEMPTWMQRDENAVQRATRASSDPAALEWLSMFEEAPGFRVRLIPNIERAVVNTFSQLPFEKNLKYSIKANSIGFRGDEIKPKKDSDVYRILVFGDSSSFGWGVNQDEYFTALLPNILNKNFPSKKIEVGNFAIPGDSSEYGRLIAENFIPEYKGDLVIFGFGANDAKSSPVSHTSQVEKFRSNNLVNEVQGIAQYSALFRSLRALISNYSIKDSKNEPKQSKRAAVGKDRYVNNLKAMANLAISNGATDVLILNLCTPGTYAKSASKLAEKQNWLYLNGQARLLEIIPSIIAGQVEVELAEDMRSKYKKDLERDPLFYVTSDSCHPNKLGHKIVAQDIANIISHTINN